MRGTRISPHVIVLGLGCEVNQIGGLMEEQKLAGRLRAMDIQDIGGTRKTVEAGVAFVREALAEANKVKREPVPASELTVALQCGGSDGYSGVSANPALGAASDLLVRHGGTVILSETPETYGAEHLLTRRAVSREVGEKLVALMRWWEEYTEREGAEMNANPSPGNKAGGLTTILEKSLGAMAKAGSTNLVDVVHYAEAVTRKGFVFMDTPGYDPVAATGQVAGGANLVCFTTGRGSVFGCKPAPSIKLATNSPMFKRMEDDMDVNCGTILDGDETVQQCGQRIFELMLQRLPASRPRARVLISAAPSSRPGCLARRCRAGWRRSRNPPLQSTTGRVATLLDWDFVDRRDWLWHKYRRGHAMLSVPLNPDIERRLSELSKRTGRSESDFARELIEGNIEDLEDRYLAEKAIEEGGPRLTGEQARKELGLEH